MPYSTWYGASYTKLQIWRGSTTPILAYFQVHGLFLFLVIGFLFGETRNLIRYRYIDLFDDRSKFIGISLVSGLILLVIPGLVLFVSGVVIGPVILAVATWSSFLMLMPVQNDGKKMCFGLISIALLLTLFVEIVRLDGDISRMNTVFKFYLQVWTLFSVVGGVALAWLVGQSNAWSYRSRIIWSGAFLILILVSISYTVLAIPAKTRDRMADTNQAGLDGMDFMQYAFYQDQGQSISLKSDYDAITWMQENIQGSPVIVEAHAPEYRLGSRYSMYTGLPGVVGWSWHQRQQRAATPPNLVTDRVEATNAFYRNIDINEALSFLDTYDVKYIVVGEYELAYYPSEGIDKFKRMAGMGLMDVRYENDGVVIYSYESDVFDGD